MPNFTTQLQLEKPTPEDFYDVEVLNKNWDKIDEELPKRVPQTRTINKKPLSADVTLTGEDIPAGAEDEKTLSSHLAECKNSLVELTYTRTIDPPQSSDDVWSLTPNVVYSWAQTNPLAWQPADTLPGALRVELIVHRPDNKQGTLSVVLSYVDGAVSLLRYVGEVHHDGSIRWARIATALPSEEIPLNLAAGVTPIASKKNACNKDQFGIVRVWLSVQFASIPPDGSLVLTLPDGFRPSATCYGAVTLAYSGSMYAATLFVSPDGTVCISHRADAHVGAINLHGFIELPA